MSWTKKIGAITMFVADVARAKEFYASTFEVPVAFEDGSSVVFSFDGLLVNLLQVTEAGELIAPATVGGPEAGARDQLTIWVDDVDAVAAELTERGVSLLNGPVDRPWGQRTLAFADPDGHVWEIATTID